MAAPVIFDNQGPQTYNPGYNPNMPWGRRGSGYFDDRRDPYNNYGGRRRSRDRWDDDHDDYYRGPRRNSWDDRGDWRDRDRDRNRFGGNWDRPYDGYRGPNNWDNRDRDRGYGYDDRHRHGGYRNNYYDRNGDGLDDRYHRPAEVVRTTRYVDDYDRGVTRYVDPAPTVVKRTTYTDPVVTTTRPLVSSGDVVKTTTTRTVTD